MDRKNPSRDNVAVSTVTSTCYLLYVFVLLFTNKEFSYHKETKFQIWRLDCKWDYKKRGSLNWCSNIWNMHWRCFATIRDFYLLIILLLMKGFGVWKHIFLKIYRNLFLYLLILPTLLSAVLIVVGNKELSSSLRLGGIRNKNYLHTSQNKVWRQDPMLFCFLSDDVRVRWLNLFEPGRLTFFFALQINWRLSDRLTVSIPICFYPPIF